MKNKARATYKTISFQGAHGAYSDMAARDMFPKLETVPCTSFEDAFNAVKEKRTDLAMIPVDNTLAGRVADVHRLLPEGGLFIIGEHFIPIRHALLGVKGAKISDLKHVHSHVHAIPQCRKLIKSLKLKPHVGSDTAGCALEVSRLNDKSHAAIASELTAKLYGLEILKKNVQDEDHNTTRFLVFSRDHIIPPYNPKKHCLTSFLFRTRNIPAALYKALGGFATNGVSLSKLESYVDPAFDAAQFYCEVEGHPESPALSRALEELRFFANELRLIGTYETHAFRKK